jgi:hypothetical protein
VFLRDTLVVPVEEREKLSATELWPPIVADAHSALPDRFFQSRPSNESSALNSPF